MLRRLDPARRDDRTPRYLGAAFVFQFATSLAAGIVLGSILSGDIEQVFEDISGNLGQMRAAIVLELLTSVGIIVLTSLFYVVLSPYNRTVALVAFALWMAEAVMLAVKTLSLYALVSLSQGRVEAGAPSFFSNATLGKFSLGVSQHATDVGMLFFCLGGLLWYTLLYRTRIVPRPLSLWGLLATCLVLVATVLLVWDRSSGPSIALYAAYVPFELVLGLWLLVKGAPVASPRPSSPTGEPVTR